MKLQRYNKMFAAAVPLIVAFISMMWPESDVTASDVKGWGEALLVVAAPVLVYVVPNRDE